MAAFNGSQYISKQIETILDQKGIDIDLYVRVDPSEDDTLKIVEDFAQKYSNITCLKAIKPSGNAGQNFFNLLMEVDFDTYSYVAFADQDDIWSSGKIKHSINEMLNNNSDGYSGNVTAWWVSGKEKLIHKSHSQVKFDYLFESSGPGCTFLFNRALADEIKQFIRSLGDQVKCLWLHDWFCYAFARSRGYRWYIDSIPMMKYRQHDNNSVGANSGFLAFKERIVEVASGKAFDKVISQAEVLGLIDLLPIKLLVKRNPRSLIHLALYASQCRRKPLDKVLFIFAMLLNSISGEKKK
ncbi:glycosyltransferase [Vibrio breoganii]